MTTLDESNLNFSAINEIDLIINKKKSEIESLTRVRNDLLRALKEEFIIVSDESNIENIGILMGKSSKYLGKVRVLDVIPESFAANSGILKGDIIRKVNDEFVSNFKILDIKNLINKLIKKNENLIINVERNKKKLDVLVELK